jgi:hypothetical protein
VHISLKMKSKPLHLFLEIKMSIIISVTLRPEVFVTREIQIFNKLDDLFLISSIERSVLSH